MKKGKLATDYVVIGIIIVVVIFVITLTVLNLTSVSFGELESISDDVFVDPAIAEDAVNDASVRAMSSLMDNLDTYCIGERDGCSCYTGQLGSIEEGAIVVVENQEDKNTITVINDNGAYLEELSSNFELGLFVMGGGGGDFGLSCVFPDKFYITSETEDYINYWYINFEDSFTDRSWYQNGEDNLFSIYSQERSGIFDTRRYEETFDDLLFSFYKIDDNHICILTDLIEMDLEDASGDYLTTIQSKEELKDFFDDSNLCHKDSTEASEEELEDSSLGEPVDFSEGTERP
jgi:hypothetical protein